MRQQWRNVASILVWEGGGGPPNVPTEKKRNHYIVTLHARASEASERHGNIYLFRSQNTWYIILHTYAINVVPFYYLWYGAVDKQQSTDKTLTLGKSINMGASELGERAWNISHFNTQKLLFLSIFCWYFRYFVGTNYMIVGLHVPTNFQMKWYSKI